MASLLTPSQLFLKAHNNRAVLEGEDRCHWCATPCKRLLPHDDVIQIPFTRTNTTAKCPSNSYICMGCWMYRRKRVTVRYLSGGFQDGQSATDHSWWLTDTDAFAIRPDDYHTLYAHLLKPPIRFSLMLKTNGHNNLLQCGVANENAIINASTRLFYTVNGTPFAYTPSELEQGLRGGPEGKEAGVAELMRILGPYSFPVEEEVVRGKGRPPKGEEDLGKVRKVIAKSGGK